MRAVLHGLRIPLPVCVLRAIWSFCPLFGWDLGSPSTHYHLGHLHRSCVAISGPRFMDRRKKKKARRTTRVVARGSWIPVCAGSCVAISPESVRGFAASVPRWLHPSCAAAFSSRSVILRCALAQIARLPLHLTSTPGPASTSSGSVDGIRTSKVYSLCRINVLACVLAIFYLRGSSIPVPPRTRRRDGLHHLDSSTSTIPVGVLDITCHTVARSVDVCRALVRVRGRFCAPSRTRSGLRQLLRAVHSDSVLALDNRGFSRVRSTPTLSHCVVWRFADGSVRQLHARDPFPCAHARLTPPRGFCMLAHGLRARRCWRGFSWHAYAHLLLRTLRAAPHDSAAVIAAARLPCRAPAMHRAPALRTTRAGWIRARWHAAHTLPRCIRATIGPLSNALRTRRLSVLRVPNLGYARDSPHIPHTGCAADRAPRGLMALISALRGLVVLRAVCAAALPARAARALRCAPLSVRRCSSGYPPHSLTREAVLRTSLIGSQSPPSRSPRPPLVVDYR